MSPISSDNFAISDFDSTFAILDAQPGIKPVANYASLPTGLTTNQNGSQFIQLDNLAQWMWSKPTSAAGVWVRTNSIGYISTIGQTGQLSTSSTTTPGAQLCTTTITIPGGRGIKVEGLVEEIHNDSSSGIGFIQLLYSSANTSMGYVQVGDSTGGYVASILQPQPAGTSMQFKLIMRSGAAYGGTTSNVGNAFLYISEM